MSQRVAAVIPAGGSGKRLGAPLPKALVQVAEKSLLRHSVEALAPFVQLICVAAPDGYVDQVRAELADIPVELQVVVGGAERQHSVRAALELVPDSFDTVLVHDAARPFVPAEVIERVLEQLRHGAVAAIPVMDVADTVKEVNEVGVVVRTINRSKLRLVQTPQGFGLRQLRSVYKTEHELATDDAALFETAGIPVVTVAGSPLAFKVTTQDDLATAQAKVQDR